MSRQAGTFGQALAVPLRSAAGISGVLLAVRDKGAAPFEPEQVPVLGSFADQAALALETAQTQRTQQLLELLADRDRIARDLHDHVIQRLYAAGMSLQGTLRVVTGHDARGRIHQVVDQLDDTIRDIRTTIFDLHTTGEDKPGSMRRRLLDAAAAVSTARPGPSVRMSGAHASAITVTTEAGEDLVIEVIDNGIGIPEDVARSGLANLEERAAACHGTFTVAAQPGDTRLTWRVPLP